MARVIYERKGVITMARRRRKKGNEGILLLGGILLIVALLAIEEPRYLMFVGKC